MTPAYVVNDDRKNAGQQIPITRGETKVVTMTLFNPDGTLFVYTAVLAEILVKVFSNISQASIQKRLSLAAVTPLTCAALGGMIGFQFTLLPADTNMMAANNSSLPMLAVITDVGGNVTELNFLAVFSVDTPAVLT